MELSPIGTVDFPAPLRHGAYGDIGASLTPTHLSLIRSYMPIFQAFCGIFLPRISSAQRTPRRPERASPIHFRRPPKGNGPIEGPCSTLHRKANAIAGAV